MKRRATRTKRRAVRSHVITRAAERYQIKLCQHDLDLLNAAVRYGGAVVLPGKGNFLFWLPDGRKIKFAYTRRLGVVTILPLKGDELKHLPV